MFPMNSRVPPRRTKKSFKIPVFVDRPRKSSFRVTRSLNFIFCPCSREICRCIPVFGHEIRFLKKRLGCVKFERTYPPRSRRYSGKSRMGVPGHLGLPCNSSSADGKTDAILGFRRELLKLPPAADVAPYSAWFAMSDHWQVLCNR